MVLDLLALLFGLVIGLEVQPVALPVEVEAASVVGRDLQLGQVDVVDLPRLRDLEKGHIKGFRASRQPPHKTVCSPCFRIIASPPAPGEPNVPTAWPLPPSRSPSVNSTKPRRR